MKAITLSASFDGERIRLEEDFPLPKNARLLVTILPTDENDDAALRSWWHGVSEQSLLRPYGPEEPEYTEDMVREPNADYEGRWGKETSNHDTVKARLAKRVEGPTPY